MPRKYTSFNDGDRLKYEFVKRQHYDRHLDRSAKVTDRILDKLVRLERRVNELEKFFSQDQNTNEEIPNEE